MPKVTLTATRIAALHCDEAKSQAFLYDADTKGLGVRVTPNGQPSFFWAGPIVGLRGPIRMTIGKVGQPWSIADARVRARAIQTIVDNGRDPRVVADEVAAKDIATRAAAREASITVGEAWSSYMEDGRPAKKIAWKPKYKESLIEMAKPGGLPYKRGTGTTLPGPIFELLSMNLKDIDADILRAWVIKQNKRGSAQANRALQMFSGFLRWCYSHKLYEKVIDANWARDDKVKANTISAGKPRNDQLESTFLRGWFETVFLLPNRQMSAYLIALLLTGARKEEMAAVKWIDINFKYSRMKIADKMHEDRVIPVGPFLLQLLKSLPKIDGNDYVFASSRSASGHLVDSRKALAVAVESAEINHLTPHGLRRSFNLLGEEAEVPEGAINQISGHKPKTQGERYKPRNVGQLQKFMLKIEQHILLEGGVDFDYQASKCASNVTPIRKPV